MQLTNKIKDAINAKINEFSSDKYLALSRNADKCNNYEIEKKVTQELRDTLRPVIAAWVNQKFSNISSNVAYKCGINYRTDVTTLVMYTKKELVNSLVNSLTMRADVTSLPAYKAKKKFIDYKNLIVKTRDEVFLKIPFIKTQEEFDDLMYDAKQKLK